MNTKLIHRKSFLKAASAALPALSALAQAPAASKRRAFRVEPSAGPRDAMLKISGADTGGEFALFEIPPGNAGPPLHVHHVENELFWVLEGELEVQVGSEMMRLTAGACAYAPRMVPHTWQAVGGGDVRFLALASPAGRLELFIAELLRRRRSGLLDAGSMKSLFESYDMEVVGPALVKKAK